MADYGAIRQRWTRIRVAESSASDASSADTAPVEAQPSTGTFIAAGAIFEGTLSLKGDFRIDSEFRGELETDGTITVGPHGSVVGHIRAREVVIRGAVVGNVTAPRQLIVEANGKLHGDIETACLEIQKHAFFRGHTSMTQPQTSRMPELSATPETAPVHAPL